MRVVAVAVAAHDPSPAIATSGEGAGDESFEHQLAVARLGIAGSLFTALDCKRADGGPFAARGAGLLALGSRRRNWMKRRSTRSSSPRCCTMSARWLSPTRFCSSLATRSGRDGTHGRHRQAGLRILGCSPRRPFSISCAGCRPGTTAAA